MKPVAAAYRAGLSRVSITAFDPQLSMFGWGHPDNRPVRVGEPLYARALALESEGGRARLVYVCCDLGLISEGLRRRVCERLRAASIELEPRALVLTATHTHAGPSGLSDYLFFAMAGPGRSPGLCDVIADRVVLAIRESLDRLAPARLYLHEAPIALSEPIAFNRSVAAYNRNPDVAPVTEERRDEAVDRSMVVIRVDDAAGSPLGMVSWFGLHGTCLHADNVAIHPDHKGVAARIVEEHWRARRAREYVAIFAQTAPGDVTPNYRRDPRRGVDAGRYEDDVESAELVGAVQARHALQIAEDAPRAGVELRGALRVAMRSIDMFQAPVRPDLAHGCTGLTTAPPAVGWSFMGGTAEGRGPLGAIASLLPRISHWRARLLRLAGKAASPQHPKIVFWDLAKADEGAVLGVFPPRHPLVPRIPDDHVRYFASALRDPDVAASPCAPRWVPVQLARIDGFVLAALPFEPTVTSGRRLMRSVLSALPDAGRCVVNGYSNAYAGYAVTPEEYDEQAYEGASTLYGRNTIPALCTAVMALAEDLATEDRAAPTPPVTPKRRAPAPSCPVPQSEEELTP